MASNGYIDWVGISGRRYRYYFVQYVVAWGIQSGGGNYCLAVRQASGLFLPAYFGIADDIKVRLPNHEHLQAARAYGELNVMAHLTPAGDAARKLEERDLIQFWNPPLNIQHRSVR